METALLLPLLFNASLTLEDKTWIESKVDHFGYRCLGTAAIREYKTRLTEKQLIEGQIIAFRYLLLHEHEAIAEVNRICKQEKKCNSKKTTIVPQPISKTSNKRKLSKKENRLNVVTQRIVSSVKRCFPLTIQQQTNIQGLSNDATYHDRRYLFIDVPGITTAKLNKRRIPADKRKTEVYKPTAHQKMNMLVNGLIRKGQPGKWEWYGFPGQYVLIWLDAKDEYAGHLYIWPSNRVALPWFPNSLEMIGIRASLKNIACKTVSRLAEKMLQVIIGYFATAYQFDYIDVDSPLPVMQHILTKHGFHNARGLNTYLLAVNQARLPIIADESNIRIKEYKNTALISFEKDQQEILKGIAKQEKWKKTDRSTVARFLQSKLRRNLFQWTNPTIEEFKRYVSEKLALNRFLDLNK